MRTFPRFAALAVVLILALALAGCKVPFAGSSAPAQSAGDEDASASVPDTLAPQQPAGTLPDGLATEAGAPAFLEAEQQALYLEARALYGELFGPSIGAAMAPTGGEAPEAMDVKDENRGISYTYYKASGPYARWDDLYTALTAVFTEEYTGSLLAGEAGGPAPYLDREGEVWYLGADRGSHIDYTGADSFAEGTANPTAVAFYVVGHYRDRTNSRDYTEQYPIMLEKTSAGWRFSQFSLTY